MNKGDKIYSKGMARGRDRNHVDGQSFKAMYHACTFNRLEYGRKKKELLDITMELTKSDRSLI